MTPLAAPSTHRLTTCRRIPAHSARQVSIACRLSRHLHAVRVPPQPSTPAQCAGEMSALRLIGQLRKLCHLELRIANSNTYRTVPATTPQWLAEHQRQTTALQQLSCLTALTHLELDLAHHRRCDTRALWPRCSGPALQASPSGARCGTRSRPPSWPPCDACRSCKAFHLPASEVSALASLTSLRVAGLVGPTTSPDAPASPPQPGAKAALPPQLRTLWMPCGSVQTLAAIQPPEVLEGVDMGKRTKRPRIAFLRVGHEPKRQAAAACCRGGRGGRCRAAGT